MNAELLDDSTVISYRDLQRLCARLKLGGKGKRSELVEKLQRWHRSRSPTKASTTDSPGLPMNVPGANFSLLDLNLNLSPGGDKENSMPSDGLSRKSLGAHRKSKNVSRIGGDAGDEAVSPRLLNPLRRANDINTPKSILKDR